MVDKEKIAASRKLYRENNLEEIKKQKQRYYQEHRENILAKRRKYREEHLVEIKVYQEANKEKMKEYCEEHKDERNAYGRKYREENIEKELERSKRYYYSNLEKERRRSNENRKENKEWFNNYHIERRKNDFSYKLMHRLRVRLGHAMKSYSKNGKIKKSDEYGIDYEAIINHLKSFPDNLGDYHIDHIIPLRLFDLENPEQVKKAFSPSNHQWLITQKNLEKSGRLVHPNFYK